MSKDKGLKRLNNLNKVMDIGSYRSRIQTQVYLTPKSIGLSSTQSCLLYSGNYLDGLPKGLLPLFNTFLPFLLTFTGGPVISSLPPYKGMFATGGQGQCPRHLCMPPAPCESFHCLLDEWMDGLIQIKSMTQLYSCC